MSNFELAQLNVAKMKAPLESPTMAVFVDNLDRINQLAEASPGYVWRLETDDGDATALRPFGDDILVNMSVWQDLNSLRNFVFRTDHSTIMRRRQEWFERAEEAYVVFWWVPAGRRPTVQEAKEKLEHLMAHGPTEQAFTFRSSFPAPDSPSPAAPGPFLDACTAT